MTLSQKQVKAFQREISSFYKEQGRNFPWRNTHDLYAIFVSEIMLQQTQADRVIPKYCEFLSTFSDFTSLASASL
ncbi:MAG: hypothetical protein ACOX6V_00100 [Patescibacteria group bacterium]